MEAKLRTMEQRLQLDGAPVPAVGAAADLVAQALDGQGGSSGGAVGVQEDEATTYHFGEGVPSAADFNKTVEAINGSHAAK